MSAELGNAGALGGTAGSAGWTPADAVKVAKAPAPAVAAPAAGTELHVVRRAEIKFDPAEMRRNLDDAIQRLNEQLHRNDRNIAFRVDDAVNTTVITVHRTDTGEVVRQIPSEAVLRVAHSIEDLKGILYSDKA